MTPRPGRTRRCSGGLLGVPLVYGREAVLTCCLSLLTVSNGIAAEWIRVPAIGSDQHYYDRSKVSIRGDEVTYWRKVSFGKPVRVRSGTARQAVYQERIHCQDHTLRVLAWQLFAEEGAMQESSAAADPEPTAIVPETIGDRFQEVMCAMVTARRQRDADIARDEAALSLKRKELEALKSEIEKLEARMEQMRNAEAPSPAGNEAPLPKVTDNPPDAR